MRRNTHKPAPDGGGEVFDTTIEAPIAIRDPEKRVGTHIFTAVATSDTGLRWTAVTIDGADDATDVLDRITIRRTCSIALRRPHCRDRRSSSRMNR